MGHTDNHHCTFILPSRQEIITNDIEPSSRYHVLSDGTLMIDDTTYGDQGTYGCMAQNTVGEAHSGSATLILESNSVGRNL